MVKTSVAHEAQPSVSLMFLPHFLFLPYFDVICDLLLNRRTATWNLFAISINLLEVYRESVNLIGNITHRLSADSLQL